MRLTEKAYTSNLYMWNDAAAIFFANTITPYHCHNTLQIVFDLNNDFKFKTLSGAWSTHTNLIIKENVSHRLDSRGSMQLIIYLDAKSVIARVLNAKYLDGRDIGEPELSLYDSGMLQRMQRAILTPDESQLKRIIDELLVNLTGKRCFTITDSRIKAVNKYLICNRPQKNITAALAEMVFLSESRLRSLFKEQTGISLHRFIIWNNVQHAITLLLNRATIQNAAYASGFSDISHFNKTLVNMFGITPSAFLKARGEYKLVSPYPNSIAFKTMVGSF